MNTFEEGIILSLWILYEAFLSVAGLLLNDKRSRKRRRHRWWIKPIIRQRHNEGTTHVLLSKTPSDGFYYEDYFRMSKENFNFLLTKISTRIEKPDTHFRRPISPADKLSVTLRFLATGIKSLPC
jgi:hypothetical protein